MPADRRTRTIFVYQGHGESVSIDTSPASNLGAKRHQEIRKRPGCGPIVRLAKKCDAPPCHDAPHFEFREGDVAESVEQDLFVSNRNEVVAIREARGHIVFEELGRRLHEPVSHGLPSLVLASRSPCECSC